MKRLSWLVLLGVIAFFLAPALFGGVPADDAGEPEAAPAPIETDTPTPSAEEEIEAERQAFERAILREINRERRSRDLGGLSMSEPQRELAREHSKDMARDGYYAHEAPDGRTFLPPCRPSGEVLYISEGPYLDPERHAEWVVEAWLESPEHKEIILSPRWTSAGIGSSYTGGDEYVTGNFC